MRYQEAYSRYLLRFSKSATQFSGFGHTFGVQNIMLSNYRLNHVSNEDLQAVTVVPYKHAIFQSQHHHRRQSCCSVSFPMAFERAAPKSILNPHFDSIILEGQFQSSVFPQIRWRYR